MHNCRLIELQEVRGDGILSVAETGRHVPFEIRRVFFIHHISEGATRAGHALKGCEQLLIAAGGAFDVILDDGRSQCRKRLDRPDLGLYVPAMTWRTLENFTPSSICLVLASQPFNEASYYRSYEDFKAAALGIA